MMFLFHERLIGRRLGRISARQHGPARGVLEGLQPVGPLPLQVQGQPLHQEQGRVRAPPPLLPEWPQRNMQGESTN